MRSKQGGRDWDGVMGGIVARSRTAGGMGPNLLMTLFLGVR